MHGSEKNEWITGAKKIKVKIKKCLKLCYSTYVVYFTGKPNASALWRMV